MGVMAKGHGVSSWGDESVLKLIVHNLLRMLKTQGFLCTINGNQ